MAPAISPIAGRLVKGGSVFLPVQAQRTGPLPCYPLPCYCIYLTTDATKTLVCAFVLSKLGYCISLLSSCLNQLLNKLRKVQNSAARLVLKARKQDYIKPFPQKLHWQPAQSRIQYKISTLCDNSFSETDPLYLSELLTVYYQSRQVRSI